MYYILEDDDKRGGGNKKGGLQIWEEGGLVKNLKVLNFCIDKKGQIFSRYEIMYFVIFGVRSRQM